MIYVLQVLTGKELSVRAELLRRGITAEVPREKILIRRDGLWSKKIKLLFPGYVFTEIDFTSEIFHKIKPVPGIIKFLGQPTPLSDREAEMIRWLSNGGEIIEPSIINFDANENITGYEGFLNGRESEIKYLNLRQKKARIEVRFGGKVHKANISVETRSE